MSQTLSRTGIVVPSADRSDPVHPVADIRAIGLWAESYGFIVLPSAAYSSIPSASTFGRVFHPNDAGRESEFYFDTGTAWQLIGVSPPVDGSAGTPSLRTLGGGSTQAAAGNHGHSLTALGFLPGTVWRGFGAAYLAFNAVHSTGRVPGPVARNGSTIVAQQDTSFAYLSTDAGVTWSSTGTFTSTPSAYAGMSYGAGLFVAVLPRISTNVLVTNPGSSAAWTNRTLPATQQWWDTAWNGSIFAAVGKSSGGGNTTAAASSTDGTTWTSRVIPSGDYGAVCWDGTKFIAISQSSATCAVSTDGLTWTSGGSLSDTPYAGTSIATDGAGTCVLGCNAGYMYTTDHGATWTSRYIPETGMLHADAYYANGYWFIIPWTNGTAHCGRVYVTSTADLTAGKLPGFVASPQGTSGGSETPVEIPAWILDNGSTTLAATSQGLYQA